MKLASPVSVNLKAILGAIAATLLFFFGIMLALATDYWPTGLVISAMFFVVGLGVIYIATRKPTTIVQKVDVSGELKAIGIKCPNCGASVSAERLKAISGVPYATCPYCGHTFEVAEEPKW